MEPVARLRRAKKNDGPSLTLDRLLGIGVACIGLSPSEFDRLTPSEFRACTDAWQLERERCERNSWEIARTSAAILIRPHISKSVSPQKLLPMPWDKATQNKAPKLTREQQGERFRQLVQRLG